MVPTVIIVGADKGGVGKTTVSRALIDYCKTNGMEWRAFDTETPHGALIRYYPGEAQLVDLTKSDGHVSVFDTLTKSPFTIIDARAGLLSYLLGLLRDIGYLDMAKDNKLRIMVLHIIGATVTSFAEIRTVSDLIRSAAKYHLVANHINDASFFNWNADQQAMLAMSDGLISIPKLDALAAEHVEHSGLSFGDFGNNADQSQVLRGYVKFWLTEVFRQFDLAKLNAS